jgi:hypothetical protein
MEQGREARDRAQVEAWVEAAVAEARDAVDKGEEVAFLQAPAATASAPSAGKRRRIKWGRPVMNSSAQNAVAR